MGKDGGIAFYTSTPARSLLFWTFGSACMVSFLSINLPSFDRPDTFNPYFEDIRSTWCAPPVPFSVSRASESAPQLFLVPLCFRDTSEDLALYSIRVACTLALWAMRPVGP
jgi:hypothetical protein